MGSSPSGLSMCTTFRAGGIDFLQIHLACDTPVAELSWAQAILDRNRHVPAMLTTHRYLQDAEDYTGGVPLVSSGRYPDIWYAAEGLYDPNGIRSEEFWRWFVRRNTNVFMVTCGPFHEEYRQVSTNVAGRPVHEVLADYQDDPNGGDGWMRIMRFDTAAGVIDVDTYSPTLGAIRTAEESDFDLAVDFAAYTLPGGVSFKASSAPKATTARSARRATVRHTCASDAAREPAGKMNSCNLGKDSLWWVSAWSKASTASFLSNSKPGMLSSPPKLNNWCCTSINSVRKASGMSSHSNTPMCELSSSTSPMA